MRLSAQHPSWTMFGEALRAGLSEARNSAAIAAGLIALTALALASCVAQPFPGAPSGREASAAIFPLY